METNYLAIDFGTKRFGLAHSRGFYATSMDPLLVNDHDYNTVCDQIIEIIKNKQINRIIIGWPKKLNNELTWINNKIDEFCLLLKSHKDWKDDIQIIKWDERYTSKIAENYLIQFNVKRKKKKN